MKYVILDENNNPIQWGDDDNYDAISKLPAGAIPLTDEQWENRFVNIKVPTADKINNLKRNLISTRKAYLAKTQNDAFEAVIEGVEYPFTAKRNLAKQEIRNIEAAKTLTALNQFEINFE